MNEPVNEVLFDLFRMKATAVSAEVHRFERRTEALAFVTGFLVTEGVRPEAGKWGVWADRDFLSLEERVGIADKVPGILFDVTQERAADALVGVSAMDGGIADTGTLFQDATAPELRLVSTLPPIHLAFVPTGRILPDLASALVKLDPSKSPYLTFITGPSRTADIERVLTIGVHGPGRLVVVCYDRTEE